MSSGMEWKIRQETGASSNPLISSRERVIGEGYGYRRRTCGKKVEKQTMDKKERLEYLRGELRGECLSYGELSELQNLAPYIEKDDLELLEAAGVPEFLNDAEESQDLIEALKSFCDTVEQTGGLVPDPEGSGRPVPAASDDWVDLAAAYEQAARALTAAGHLRTVSYDMSETPLQSM